MGVAPAPAAVGPFPEAALGELLALPVLPGFALLGSELEGVG